MIYSVRPDGDGFVLVVEDGEGVLLTIPAATLTEAKALQRRAVIDGLDSVSEVRPDVKAKRKK